MHGSARSPARLLSLLRGLHAALLAPALVLGTFDLHSSELPHGAFDGPGVVLADARHPLQPEHLEASVAVRLPSCPACLLHVKSSNGAVAMPALEPEPVIAGAGLAFAVDPPLVAPRFRLASRAPPTA